MPIELKVPSVGESITEVQIGAWLKSEGSAFQKDEPLVSIESEKATLEVPAPAAGVVSKILKQKGQVAKVGEVVALLEAASGSVAPAVTNPPPSAVAPVERVVMPAAARVLSQAQAGGEDVQGTGPGGRILKEDAQRHVETLRQASVPPPPLPTSRPAAPSAPASLASGSSREEEAVPMSPLRRTIARRLVEAQNTMAMLTTFNEIDMSAVMQLRKTHQDAFMAKYQVKLGFMSFFVKAAVDALRLVPQLNAEIRGNEILYRNYQDIGVAIGGGKGLVVPVLRGAERLSFAEVEIGVNEFAKRAKENKIKMEELEGGTFTISNGGVYGSLLSTPIINPPQSGILGLHTIQDRPVAIDGQVVIRPMMYVALSYDHRLVDGREAVTFLKRIKEIIENPVRILLEV
ncbi:MAG: 2-oxoglutarate dehydrogenase complex dihydrolipoyllysine-residue succinyltransferase [Verrucomicrobia bacterium]|nr:2-oxoglutarate dehydrogenase complex dihydrolipoyllysine-residue succinyltransferase [Verrucomicrobiota bacterium]